MVKYSFFTEDRINMSVKEYKEVRQGNEEQGHEPYCAFSHVRNTRATNFRFKNSQKKTDEQNT